MSYILHIDTSAENSGVAISQSGTIRASALNDQVRNHATAINTMIDSVLTDAGITVSDLNAVAVCSGPGSYTGLRIALATAKGICYAAGIPLLMHDRLKLIYLSQPSVQEGERRAIILVAREHEYFVAVYDSEGTAITAPTHMTGTELEDILNRVDNLHITTNALSETFYKPKVSFLSFDQNITIDFHFWAEFAYGEVCKKIFSDIAHVTPLYLKQVYTHK